MQINQIISTIAYGDAVSNDAVAIKRIIKEMGYQTNIYAESIVPPYNQKTALPIDKMKDLNKDDIVIYHMSTGSQLSFDFAKYPCRKIVIYHNITPPEFFNDNDEFIKGINEWGLVGARYLHDKVDYVLAVSEFNKQDLIRMGYQCPIDVLPIIIPMQDYEKKPDKRLIREYGNKDYTNIVFTGRMVPNKKQEDLISAFYYYKKLYNPKSRLFLVGNFKTSDVYYRRLADYIRKLGLDDIIITGHIKFNQILSYYRIADVFLCMSEHEGFCVPLVEAMHFKTPIIAYNSTAIPSTLGGSGFLIDDKDPVFVAGCIDRLVKDQQLQETIVQKQNERLKDFQYDQISKSFVEYLEAFINKKD